MTVPAFRRLKGQRKISMLTAYDFPLAKLLDQSRVDAILVGDSLGTVIYGRENTLSVTLDEMIRHAQAVSSAVSRALLVVDLPFLTYQVSDEQAILTAGRILKETRAQAVKLEGGIEMAGRIRAIASAGIPVMAHIGLTPQSVHALGGYRIQGRVESEAADLKESALAVEKAGAFSVVLECVESSLSEQITQTISIPTIGIGSGAQCDGQVLVTHDLVGLNPNHVPKFVEPVANLKEDFLKAIDAFVDRTSCQKP